MTEQIISEQATLRDNMENAWRNLNIMGCTAVAVTVNPNMGERLKLAGLITEPALTEVVNKSREGTTAKSYTLYGLPVAFVAGLDPNRVYWSGRHHTIVAVTENGRVFQKNVKA